MAVTLIDFPFSAPTSRIAPWWQIPSPRGYASTPHGRQEKRKKKQDGGEMLRSIADQRVLSRALGPTWPPTSRVLGHLTTNFISDCGLSMSRRRIDALSLVWKLIDASPSPEESERTSPWAVGAWSHISFLSLFSFPPPFGPTSEKRGGTRVIHRSGSCNRFED